MVTRFNDIIETNKEWVVTEGFPFESFHFLHGNTLIINYKTEHAEGRYRNIFEMKQKEEELHMIVNNSELYIIEKFTHEEIITTVKNHRIRLVTATK